MESEFIKILLADDDQDDCSFFKEALEELPIKAKLATVRDGEQLMFYLTQKTGDLPDVLFLDLNMPRKNGFECLAQIKRNKTFAQLPVIIFSTTDDQQTIKFLYHKGAQFYIRKPSNFSELKKIIQRALMHIGKKNTLPAAMDNFVINSN